MIASFSSVLNADYSILIITDTSTPDYQGEVISTRALTFELADGTYSTVDFEISNGVGDVYAYPVDGDGVVSISLELTPVVGMDDSVYEKTVNILFANELSDRISELRISLLLDNNSNLEDRESKRTLSIIQTAAAFLQSADDLKLIDISEASRLLAYGTDFLNGYNNSIK
jgi:hypothetical protein